MSWITSSIWSQTCSQWQRRIKCCVTHAARHLLGWEETKASPSCSYGFTAKQKETCWRMLWCNKLLQWRFMLKNETVSQMMRKRSGDAATAASISFTAKWKHNSDYTWSSNDDQPVDGCLASLCMRISTTRFQEVLIHCRWCTQDIHLTTSTHWYWSFLTGQDEQHFVQPKNKKISEFALSCSNEITSLI